MHIEVEAAEGQERIVQVMLAPYGDLGQPIVLHKTLIVSAVQGLEEFGTDCKEWHVLNVGIMLWGVGDDMMNIVVALPPPEAQTTQKVCNNDADYSIDVEVVSDAHMARVMGSEDKLVPKHANESSRQTIPAQLEQKHANQEKDQVAEHFGTICSIIALVKARISYPPVQRAVLLHNVSLSDGIKRWILLQVTLELKSIKVFCG